MMIIPRLKIASQKSKLLYHINNFFSKAVPDYIYQRNLKRRFLLTANYSSEELLYRLDYYNKLDENVNLNPESPTIADFKTAKVATAYIADSVKYSRYFDQKFHANFIFTDVIHIADFPTIQKARPIRGDNRNAILLNLDKKRHFLFIDDPIPFEGKLDKLIGRGSITQPHRVKFFDMHFGNPRFDLGQVNKSGGRVEWIKPKLALLEHLKYKFVLSLEGNDVATNLKWIMSSNSIAVMPTPKFETWFMEGRLIPDYHYICIRSDYADVEEKLSYYSANSEAAREIVRNANNFVNQFKDKDKEDLLSLLVLEKYFYFTSQLFSRSI